MNTSNPRTPFQAAGAIAHTQHARECQEREAQYYGLDERSLGRCITLPVYTPADPLADYEAVYHTDPYAPETDEPAPWWLTAVTVIANVILWAGAVKVLWSAGAIVWALAMTEGR